MYNKGRVTNAQNFTFPNLLEYVLRTVTVANHAIMYAIIKEMEYNCLSVSVMPANQYANMPSYVIWLS